jgi:hypothetical protein
MIDVASGAGMLRRRRTAFEALAIAGLVFVSKLPWVFTTLGEQDHARFILAAMVYAQDGAQTVRPYAMLTSPLWTLPLSWLSHVLTAPQLVLLSNVLGWCAGALTAALSYILLRQLDCARAWAAAGALAVTWIPGAFYASLYGYPSQWALPFLLMAASAFLRCLDASATRGRILWCVVSGLSFCVLVLLKVDFALVGTLLVGMAIMRQRVFDAWSLALPGIAAAAAGLALLLSRVLVEQTYGAFASGWTALYPGSESALADPFSITTLYSVGLGTAVLWGAATVVGLLRPSTRHATARALVSWAIAVLPLWIFWMARPPMSSRHALPGAVLTALFAAWVAGRQAQRWQWLAPLWLVALLAGNAVFGKAGYDFNYRPSGNLSAGVRVNRQAYAVGMDIAAAIAAPQERNKAILGRPDPQVLGGIDLVPLIEYAMASRSVSARCLGKLGEVSDWHARDIVFTDRQGTETYLLRSVQAKRVGLYRGEGVGFYAPWGLQGARINVLGVEIMEFDPQRLYDERFGPDSRGRP